MKNNVFLASKPRYEILDGLRGVAALLVVAFHLFETYSKGQVQGHTDSFLAVTANAERDLHGEIHRVKLTNHKDGVCYGDLI